MLMSASSLKMLHSEGRGGYVAETFLPVSMYQLQHSHVGTSLEYTYHWMKGTHHHQHDHVAAREERRERTDLRAVIGGVVFLLPVPGDGVFHPLELGLVRVGQFGDGLVIQAPQVAQPRRLSLPVDRHERRPYRRHTYTKQTQAALVRWPVGPPHTEIVQRHEKRQRGEPLGVEGHKEKVKRNPLAEVLAQFGEHGVKLQCRACVASRESLEKVFVELEVMQWTLADHYVPFPRHFVVMVAEEMAEQVSIVPHP